MINNFSRNFICISLFFKYAAYPESLFLKKNRYPETEIIITVEINVIKIILLLKVTAKFFQNGNFKIKEKNGQPNE